MPNRGIEESITRSKTLAQLSAEEERHFYRLLVQADDYGRFDAEANVLLARGYMAMLGIVTEDQVEAWTWALTRTQDKRHGRPDPLIILYEVDEHRYGYFPKWAKHQRTRASSSRYPDPKDGVVLTESAVMCRQPLADADSRCHVPSWGIDADTPRGHVTTHVAVTRNTGLRHVTETTPPYPPQGESGGGENSEKDDQKLDLDFAKVVKKYEDEIGLLTPHIAETLKMLLDEQSSDRICLAVDIAVKAGKRNLGYIEGIFKRAGKGPLELPRRGYGDQPRSDDPNKYTQGKYGHLVCKGHKECTCVRCRPDLYGDDETENETPGQEVKA